MQPLKILLSAGASPAAFNIIKHLQTLGHWIHAIDANEKALPLARTMADKVTRSPLADGEDYLSFMGDRIKESDLFIPFIDEEIATLLGHGDKDLWEKCLLPEPTTTRICLYKKKFQAFCTENGLPVALCSNTVPSVFKPDLGRGGKGVEMIRSLSGLAEKSRSEGVIQDFIAGDEYTIDALFSTDGRLITISARRRDIASGVSIIGTIVDPSPFFPLVEKLGDRLKFRYLINIQVIQDDKNVFHIIEINPRIAGSVMFSVYSGRDVLKGAIDVYRGEKAVFPNQQKKIRIIRYWNEHVEDLPS
jgi:carbamoyl-phosphate synthase large subunit